MADLTPGTVLGGRFEIVGVLGHGGTATVYLAHDVLRDDRVALKVLHAHLARDGGMRSRLQREVLAASRLRHPHALVAHELHEVDGRLALSMPLHPGTTLAERVASRGPLDRDALIRIARQLAGALAAAHRSGIVHRDVTPNNVLIDEAGDAMLGDFGLARLAARGTSTATAALGTSGYAAPEVYEGVRADPRSDLYGLGAVLCFAATGRAPFEAPTPMASLQRQLEDDLPRLETLRPDLPDWLRGTLEGTLRRDPRLRVQSAADLLVALDRGEEAHRPQPRRRARPHLPPGDHTVIVSERREDRERRRRMRRQRTRRRSPLEQRVTGWVEQLTGEFLQMVGLPWSRPPEERLAAAVAREAGLPDGALDVPLGMLERRFRLVRAVDQPTAVRLAREATRAGFRAEVADAEPTRTGPPSWVPVVALLVVLGIALGVVFGDGFPFWLLFVVVFAPRLAHRQGAHTPSKLPLAYDDDLRPWLTDDHADVLPPPTAATAVSATEPAGEPALTEVEALVTRCEDRLDALARALDAEAAELPEIAARDLRETLRELRARTAGLEREAKRLERELAGVEDDPDASSRVEARLERLRTLERGGGAVDRAEVEALERAVVAHRDAAALVDGLEGRLTVAMARLLEIASAADRARRDLVGRTEAGATGLLDRLREQTEMAAEALHEVDGRLPREEPAAHGAKRTAGREVPT